MIKFGCSMNRTSKLWCYCKERYVEILEFTHFVEFFSFNKIGENHKEKENVRKVTVVVALDHGCGNTKNSEYESE